MTQLLLCLPLNPNPQTIRIFGNNGADIDFLDHYGQTLLIWAALFNSINVVNAFFGEWSLCRCAKQELQGRPYGSSGKNRES